MTRRKVDQTNWKNTGNLFGLENTQIDIQYNFSYGIIILQFTYTANSSMYHALS
jgi:hypothetical protein